MVWNRQNRISEVAAEVKANPGVIVAEGPEAVEELRRLRSLLEREAARQWYERRAERGRHGWRAA